MSELGGGTPDLVHGRLQEAAHHSGYGFERACDHLEWLLEDDRWRQLTGGYADVNAFLRSVDLSAFNLAKNKPELFKRIRKVQPQASERAIGKATGVPKTTVRRRLRDGDAPGPDGPPAGSGPMPDRDPQASPGPDGPPADSGRAAARLARQRKQRKERDERARARRDEEARAAAAAQPQPVTWRIETGDFREVLAGLRDVDAIITDPPYGRKYLPLLAGLAEWADKTLTPGGVMAVLYGQTWLPEAYAALAGHRPYRWTACYLTPGSGCQAMNARVQTNWKPLLVYGGGPSFGDIIRSGDADGSAKAMHKWGQDYAAFAAIIDRLTRPGQTVADPFAGSGTTLLAAVAAGRHAIGADTDPAAVAAARARLS